MNVSSIGPMINPEARPDTAYRPASKASEIFPKRFLSPVEPQKTEQPSIFAELLNKVVATEGTAQKAVDDYTTGASQNLHETMLALGKADVTFSLMVSVRNKLLEAYKEVMRMS